MPEVKLEVQLHEAIKVPESSVDELICTQNIDRFNFSIMRPTLLRWWIALKKEGILRFTTTDATDNFTDLMQDFGFYGVSVSPVNEWRYAITARKVDYYTDARLSWNINIQEGETVLEVGGGNFPFAGATQYFDITDTFKDKLGGRHLDVGDVEEMPYEDKSFDVVLASHVVEHTDNPDVAIKELQRVGKRGVIECPSAHKDWILQEGHVHYRWQILQHQNTLIFVAISPDRLMFFNDEAMRNYMYRVTQFPAPSGYQEFMLRRAFWTNGVLLNPVVSWDDRTKLKAECVVVR